MASSLFPNGNNPIGMIQRLSGMINDLKNGNPDAIAKQMIQSNPRFAEFVRQNQGKTVEQVLNDNGIDANAFNEIVRMIK